MELKRDSFGTTTHDAARGTLELEWSAGTASMTDEDFKRQLRQLAGFAEELRPPNMLIDVTEFAHRPAAEFGAWRDEHIIPRYNGAGVKRFAFIVPTRAPGTVEGGAQPAPEGPAEFPTAYFESRDAVYEWFEGD